MPFEFVADYGYAGRPDLTPADVRWGKVATALTKRLLDAEPRARVVLRGLPPPGKSRHLVFRIKPKVAKTLAPQLTGRCEIPEGRWELIHQYFCKTCAPPGQKKWFPKFYLPFHDGHEIEKTAPTGRSQQVPWNPNFRVFFGAVSRLTETVPVLAAAAVTETKSLTPAEVEGLRRFDWVFLIGDSGEEARAALAAAGIRAQLVAAPAEDLLAWMRKEDPKLLESDEPVVSDDAMIASPEAIEALKKRITFAAGVISSRANDRLAAQKPPGVQ